MLVPKRKPFNFMGGDKKALPTVGLNFQNKESMRSSS